VYLIIKTLLVCLIVINMKVHSAMFIQSVIKRNLGTCMTKLGAYPLS